MEMRQRAGNIGSYRVTCRERRVLGGTDSDGLRSPGVLTHTPTHTYTYTRRLAD